MTSSMGRAFSILLLLSFSLFVNLSNPVNANINGDQGVGTIIDDDGTQPKTVSFQDGVDGYTGGRDTKIKAYYSIYIK